MANPKADQPPEPAENSQPAEKIEEPTAASPASDVDKESKSPAKSDAAKPKASKPEAAAPAAKPPKKSSSPARAKKQNGAAAKSNSNSGSLLPSADKLEQLKAAVTTAGGAENLLQILQHVEQAGGLSEVTESIEAYQVLKTVMEE